jgi:hypothetical protein
MMGNIGGTMPFGKHKGRNIAAIAKNDREYIENFLLYLPYIIAKHPMLAQELEKQGFKIDTTPVHNNAVIQFDNENIRLSMIKKLISNDYIEKKIKNCKRSWKEEKIEKIGYSKKYEQNSVKKLLAEIVTYRTIKARLIDLSICTRIDRQSALEIYRDINLPGDSRDHMVFWDKSHEEKVKMLLAHACDTTQKIDKIKRNIADIRKGLVEHRRTWEFAHSEEFEILTSTSELGFERSGWDAYFSALKRLSHSVFGNVECKFNILVEVKPIVGEDYPSVLRQMNDNRTRIYKENYVVKEAYREGKENLFVLLIGSYVGVSTTREQLQKYFESERYKIIWANEIGLQIRNLAQMAEVQNSKQGMLI